MIQSISASPHAYYHPNKSMIDLNNRSIEIIATNHKTKFKGL